MTRRNSWYAKLIAFSVLGILVLPTTSTWGETEQADRYVIAAQTRPTTGANDALKNNQRTIHDLMPVWYEANADGTVTATEAFAKNSELVSNTDRLAEEANIVLLPIITNNGKGNIVTELVKDESSREHHISNIITLVQERQFDGITIDYEAFSSSSRDSYGEFLEHLARSLHDQAKELAVMVHPKESDTGTWDAEAAQDWRRIGNAADTVIIMTYNYSWEHSAPGPSSPRSWLKNVLTYATTTIPAERLLVGVPFYGYRWKNGEGERLSSIQAEQERGMTKKERDTDSQEPFFERDGETIFYEDSESLQAKLQTILATIPGMKGVFINEPQDGDKELWNTIANTLPLQEKESKEREEENQQNNEQTPSPASNRLTTAITIENLSYRYSARTKTSTPALPGDRLRITLIVRNTSKQTQHNLRATLQTAPELAIVKESEREQRKTSLPPNGTASFTTIVQPTNGNIDGMKFPAAWEIRTDEMETGIQTEDVFAVLSVPKATVTFNEDEVRTFEPDIEHSMTITITNTGTTSMVSSAMTVKIEGPATLTSSSITPANTASEHGTTRRLPLPRLIEGQQLFTTLSIKTNADSLPENDVRLSITTNYQDINGSAYTTTTSRILFAERTGEVQGVREEHLETPTDEHIDTIDESENDNAIDENMDTDINPWLYVIIPGGLLILALLLVNIIASVREIRRDERAIADLEERRGTKVHDTTTASHHETMTPQGKPIEENIPPPPVDETGNGTHAPTPPAPPKE